MLLRPPIVFLGQRGSSPVWIFPRLILPLLALLKDPALPKERIQTPTPTLSSTTMSILVFLPPPFARSCCLSFRGLKSNETTQCCPHHHRLGLRPSYLFPVSREEPSCQGARINGQIRAPELVAAPAGLVQLRPHVKTWGGVSWNRKR